MATHQSFRENLLRIIAVIGLIAVLLLGAWGIIQLAFNLPNIFSGWRTPKEAITITLPVQNTSDKPFNVVWKHTGKSATEYSYALSYSCAQGLAFAVPVPTGAYQLVQCNTPFNFVSATSSMSVIPVLAKDTARATTTITVSAVKPADGTVVVKGTANTTINASTTVQGGAATTSVSTSGSGSTGGTVKPTATHKPTTQYVPSGRTQNLYGAADLAIQITMAPTSARIGSRISMQFVVTNIGTNLAPAGWMFSAALPYNPVYIYPSGGQQALYPGDKIIYTLGYDVVGTGDSYGYDYYSYSDNSYGQAQAVIQVDPNQYLTESNEGNNTAAATYQVY